MSGLDGSIKDREFNKFREATGNLTKVAVVIEGQTEALPITLETVTTPIITNLSVPLANTEVSHSIAAGTKKISFKCRGLARIQFSFTSGQSGSNYISLEPGAIYAESGLNLSSLTLYLQTSKASQTVEILEWT
jgi:hypothetical protein